MYIYNYYWKNCFFFLGDIDEETYKVMTLPRCGVKDKVGPGFGRSKRYALQGKSNYNLIP